MRFTITRASHDLLGQKAYRPPIRRGCVWHEAKWQEDQPSDPDMFTDGRQVTLLEIDDGIWTINIESLEELMKLLKRLNDGTQRRCSNTVFLHARGHPDMPKEFRDLPWINIYDDYVE